MQYEIKGSFITTIFLISLVHVHFGPYAHTLFTNLDISTVKYFINLITVNVKL